MKGKLVKCQQQIWINYAKLYTMHKICFPGACRVGIGARSIVCARARARPTSRLNLWRLSSWESWSIGNLALKTALDAVDARSAMLKNITIGHHFVFLLKVNACAIWSIAHLLLGLVLVQKKLQVCCCLVKPLLCCADDITFYVLLLCYVTKAVSGLKKNSGSPKGRDFSVEISKIYCSHYRQVWFGYILSQWQVCEVYLIVNVTCNFAPSSFKFFSQCLDYASSYANIPVSRPNISSFFCEVWGSPQGILRLCITHPEYLDVLLIGFTR